MFSCLDAAQQSQLARVLSSAQSRLSLLCEPPGPGNSCTTRYRRATYRFAGSAYRFAGSAYRSGTTRSRGACRPPDAARGGGDGSADDDGRLRNRHDANVAANVVFVPIAILDAYSSLPSAGAALQHCSIASMAWVWWSAGVQRSSASQLQVLVL